MRLETRIFDLSQNVMVKLIERRVLTLFAGAIIGAIIALFSGVVVLIAFEKHSLLARAKESIWSGQDALVEIETAFDKLQSLRAMPCTGAHLAQMRAIVFRSHSIRDAAYAPSGYLTCSSGLGTSTTQLLNGRQPDFVTDSNERVWRDVESAVVPGVRSTRVDAGNYSLLVFPLDAYSDGNAAGQPTIFLIRHNPPVAVSFGSRHLTIGTDRLFDGNTFWFENRLVAVACTAERNMCYGMDTASGELVWPLAWLVVLTVPSGGILGGWVASGALAWQQRARSLEAQLRGAVERDELFLHYQPIVDANTGAVVAAEALMRWTLPSGEQISPELFIPIAERIGLIAQITRHALRLMSAELGELLRTRPDFKISVNIAPSDLADPAFHAALVEFGKRRGILPTQVALELTERGSIEYEAQISAVARLHEEGYQIYIDDFGTGFASISALSQLAIHKIKLDKSFTSAIDTDAVAARLVPPILDMAAELDLGVIVEGVENAQQAEYFLRRGVNVMQGWLFSPAIPAAELIEAVRVNYPRVEAKSLNSYPIATSWAMDL